MTHDLRAGSLSKVLRNLTPSDWPIVRKALVVFRPYIAPLGLLLEQIPPDSNVVDIGCGTGALSALILRTGKASAICSMDPDKQSADVAFRLLARVQNGSQSITVVCGDSPSHVASALVGAGVVVMCDVLHHIPPNSQRNYIKEIADFMTPGALLILKDIDASSPFVWANRLHDRVLSGATGHELTLSAARDAGVSAGLLVAHERSMRILWYPHYQIVFRKPIN